MNIPRHLLLAFTAVLPAAAIAQAASPVPHANTQSQPLQLVMQPKDMQAELPASFTILLVNRSDHEVRLPPPAAACQCLTNGSVQFIVHFTPAPGTKPTALGKSCIADAVLLYSDILRESDTWTVLRPAESLHITVKRSDFSLEEGSGTYSFQAVYTPPSLSPEDKNTLRMAGIDVPTQILKTPVMTFNRK
ncbi:MAG: hypothetical protein WA634_19905 [Silvibacterium sp.]